MSGFRFRQLYSSPSNQKWEGLKGPATLSESMLFTGNYNFIAYCTSDGETISLVEFAKTGRVQPQNLLQVQA